MQYEFVYLVKVKGHCNTGGTTTYFRFGLVGPKEGPRVSPVDAAGSSPHSRGPLIELDK